MTVTRRPTTLCTYMWVTLTDLEAHAFPPLVSYRRIRSHRVKVITPESSYLVTVTPFERFKYNTGPPQSSATELLITPFGERHGKTF